MSAINAINNFPRPFGDECLVVLPVPTGIDVGRGDLAYWDATAKKAKPMSQYVGSGTAGTDQTALGALFLGVFNQGQKSWQTVTLPGNINSGLEIAHGIEIDIDCTSATFDPGDLVAVISSGVAAAGCISDQAVVKTATAAQAIGKVLKYYGSATTRVRIRVLGILGPWKTVA